MFFNSDGEKEAENYNTIQYNTTTSTMSWPDAFGFYDSRTSLLLHNGTSILIRQILKFEWFLSSNQKRETFFGFFD